MAVPSSEHDTDSLKAARSFVARCLTDCLGVRAAARTSHAHRRGLPWPSFSRAPTRTSPIRLFISNHVMVTTSIRTLCVAVVLALSASRACASAGDRHPWFRTCLARCATDGCVYGTGDEQGTSRTSCETVCLGHWAPGLALFKWDCQVCFCTRGCLPCCPLHEGTCVCLLHSFGFCSLWGLAVLPQGGQSMENVNGFRKAGTSGHPLLGARAALDRHRRFTVQADCEYQCMRQLEETRATEGQPPLKYHGKWCFTRVLGAPRSCNEGNTQQ